MRRADRERRLRDVEVEHGHPALIRLHEPEQRLEHRALARAVRSEQPDRPFREFRGDVLEGLVLAVDDGDAIQLYDCVHFRSVAYTESWRSCSDAFTAISRARSSVTGAAASWLRDVCYTLPRRPSSSARRRMKAITLAMC
jgi:hypothetical protein